MVSRLKKVGIALGVNPYGTAAASFTRGLLVSSFDVKPKGNPERVPEVRGTLASHRVTVPPMDYDATLKFPLDLGDNLSANIGDILANIIGVDTISGTGPYTHTFTRLDSSTPPWHNLYSDKDATDRQYTGFRANSVKFSIKGDAKEIDVEVAGVVKDESTLAPAQSLVFSGSPLVLPSQASTFTIGGSPVTNFDQIDITIFRELQRHHPIGNSRMIANAYGKTFGIDVAMQGLDFTDETERTKFKNVTSSSMNLIFTDANAAYLRFNFPEIFYSAWENAAINDTDLLRFSAGAIVTADAYSVILQNLRSTAYTA